MSSNEFPRPISFDDIQPGDTVRCEWNDRGIAYYAEMTVVCRSTSYLTESDGGTLVDLEGATWTLLDRPVKRGPAFDAERGSVWFLRTDKSLWIKSRSGSDFSSEHGRVIDAANQPDLIQRLVPFQPPSVDAELEALRSNVIDAAVRWGSRPPDAELCHKSDLITLALAVRALRDHQAGA